MKQKRKRLTNKNVLVYSWNDVNKNNKIKMYDYTTSIILAPKTNKYANTKN